jgi:hypothetical protein
MSIGQGALMKLITCGAAFVLLAAGCTASAPPCPTSDLQRMPQAGRGGFGTLPSARGQTDLYKGCEAPLRQAGEAMNVPAPTAEFAAVPTDGDDGAAVETAEPAR